jgi:phosphoribosylanthranilate isomerase
MKTGRRVVVAGGVSAENVSGLLRLGPYAVDVCSSLERSPGVKSPQKLVRFFRAARGKESRPRRER